MHLQSFQKSLLARMDQSQRFKTILIPDVANDVSKI